MKSLVAKRSIAIRKHKTSVSLENEFWVSLKQIANIHGMTLCELVATIDSERQGNTNLSSALRLYVLRYFWRLLESADGLPSGTAGQIKLVA